jgi:hypothetical protein
LTAGKQIRTFEDVTIAEFSVYNTAKHTNGEVKILSCKQEEQPDPSL